ncbi:MAG: type I DNA topoisomerase, partial [Oscillospiraceae bacterium]|nr:type I DNA topoisomerase [Oscillospiraceae bacterium]
MVIVESPAKAKTITRYLGPGYEVKASMGHIRDLPKSKIGVDPERDFAVDYQPIAGKNDVINDLKRSAKKSDKIFLATDPDREGEAISWHLKELLGLPDDRTYRVTFNEITKKVVTESIAAPRQIDMDLVDAQQARRVLDRVVGYQISPFLWKKIKRGLSAGRVQSVATRLVCEREEEIKAFKPQEYWSLDALLERVKPNLGKFTAQFYGRDKKEELHSESEVNAIMSAVKTVPFRVSDVKRQEKLRNPAPPFTTSTLQQEASRKLGMSPRKTMAVAQQLYEGVDITGEGTVGLITYMRTDSLRLSEEATAAAGRFILGRYGKEYYPGKPRVYKAREGAQDAHEAIRPSNVELVPEDIKKDLTGEQYRLYKLIWSRFLACQMSSAVYDSVTIEAMSGLYRFRATHSAVKFSGYMAVYVEGKDEEEEENQSPLPDLKEGEDLNLLDLKPQQHFTQPPARYTEASLIKALEEKGIGRPSTYAPTISTIEGREYVVKEGKYLRSTPLGETVNTVMKDKFPDIVDYAFTAQMEEKLDHVEQGEENWKDLMRDFYGVFTKELKAAEADVGERIRVPDEVSEEPCPLCGR